MVGKRHLKKEQTDPDKTDKGTGSFGFICINGSLSKELDFFWYPGMIMMMIQKMMINGSTKMKNP